jgi:hypothetical protein
MIVSEFIEWLKNQPQDATVEVIIHSSGHTYYDQGGNIEWHEFNGEAATTNNNYTQDYELYVLNGEKTIRLGDSGR